MNQGQTIFAQVMKFLPHSDLARCVRRYDGEKYVKSFTCMDQYLCMAFAQLTYRESLRDIECCLRAHQTKLWHMGMRSAPARNTLANANEQRDWRIWADFAQVLIREARELYAGDGFGADLDQAAYAFDSTTISLCLSLFPWAKFRKAKAAVKALDILPIEPGAFYILDRGYLDFARLYALAQQLAFFITRIKSNTQYRRLYSRPVDKDTGLRCDQTIALANDYAHHDYPDQLRLIRYVDPETDLRLGFLTNNFQLPALTVAKLYRCRWQVELFFRWLKQLLRIKAFFGTSENAVISKIWIAVLVYVLVAIMKKRLHLTDLSLYTILQILSASLFEKKPILSALQPLPYTKEEPVLSNQLKLF